MREYRQEKKKRIRVNVKPIWDDDQISYLWMMQRMLMLSSNPNDVNNAPSIMSRLSFGLTLIFGLIPILIAISYQHFPRDSAVVLESNATPEYEEDTLYFKLENDTVFYSSFTQQEWKPIPESETQNELKKWLSPNSTDQLSPKMQTKIVNMGIQQKLIPKKSRKSPVLSTIRIVRQVVIGPNHEDESRWISRSAIVIAGLALAVGIAACCTGVGTPVGVPLVIASLAVIGKIGSISLVLTGGATLLSHASNWLFKTPARSDEDMWSRPSDFRDTLVQDEENRDSWDSIESNPSPKHE